MSDPIEVIDTDQLIEYLGPDAPGRDQLEMVVDIANGLVSEAWTKPVDPVPWWVFSIALEAAARPARNPKGLASWTKSYQDASRTERLPEKVAARSGVYLTAGERARLQGRKRRRMGTIRTHLGY